MTDGRLLIVDDETAQMQALCDTLKLEGYATEGFDSPQAALRVLRPGKFDLLLTDLQMPQMDGIALIAAARKIDPDIGAIVMTGHGTVDTAVQAMRSGALDYILKPFRLNVVLPVLSRAQDLLRLRRENAALQKLERQRTEERTPSPMTCAPRCCSSRTLPCAWSGTTASSSTRKAGTYCR
jgi:two-component system sensor histidine kinase/response regulator